MKNIFLSFGRRFLTDCANFKNFIPGIEIDTNYESEKNFVTQTRPLGFSVSTHWILIFWSAQHSEL